MLVSHEYSHSKSTNYHSAHLCPRLKIDQAASCNELLGRGHASKKDSQMPKCKKFNASFNTRRRKVSRALSLHLSS